MSKRTPSLPQRPRGFWPTPFEAVPPLIPYLPKVARYGEPCAGDGALITHLLNLWPGGHCGWASDLEPMGPGIHKLNALALDGSVRPDMWITNPPWPRGGQRGNPAKGIIRHLMGIAPVWALLPWDVGANDYFSDMVEFCSDIVPFGRVKWVPDSDGKGKDNCAWFRFAEDNRSPCTVRPRRCP